MGETYVNLKKYKEAEEAFLTIVNSADLCFSKALLFRSKCFLSDIYFTTNEFQKLIELSQSVEDEFELTKEWYHYLGEVYENGFSEPKDYEKALSFYLKELTAQPKSLGSAFGGQCDSYKTPIKIAGWLEKGEVVQQDISRALSIYDWVVNELDFWLSRNVTVRLNKPVIDNLTYLKGLATLGQDVTHSEKWDASKKEYIQWYVDGRDTMYHVAELYELRGEIKKAVDDYSLSALYGNKKACIKLIDMYEKGIAPKRKGHSAEAWKEYLEYLNS